MRLTHGVMFGKLNKRGDKEVDTIRKVANLPVELVGEIENFMQENYISTFTAAITELVRRGLKQ